MSEFSDKIKTDVPDINKLKEELFNYLRARSVKLERKHCKTELMSEKDIEIMEALLYKMTSSKGKEQICKDLGINENGSYDKDIIKERIYNLVSNLKKRDGEEPNFKFEYHIAEELRHIVKQIECDTPIVKVIID